MENLSLEQIAALLRLKEELKPNDKGLCDILYAAEDVIKAFDSVLANGDTND